MNDDPYLPIDTMARTETLDLYAQDPDSPARREILPNNAKQDYYPQNKRQSAEPWVSLSLIIWGLGIIALGVFFLWLLSGV